MDNVAIEIILIETSDIVILADNAVISACYAARMETPVSCGNRM